MPLSFDDLIPQPADGSAPSAAPGGTPPIAYYDGGRGVSIQVGGGPDWKPPPELSGPPAPSGSMTGGNPGPSDDFPAVSRLGPDALAPAPTPAGQPQGAPASAAAPLSFDDLVPGDTARKPDFLLGLYQGAMKPLDNAAQALEWAAGKAGVPTSQIDQATGGSASDAAQQHQAYIASQVAQGKTPGFWGNVAGSTLSTLPLVAGMGPLAGGAVTGALTTNAKTPQGIALDAGIGAAGGKVADTALGALRGAIAPRVSDAVRTLIGEGVGLTPGQIAGGALKRVEDGATSIPILGDIIKNAQARGLHDFNRAAINRTLAPIGQVLPENLSSGYDAVDFAHRALGKAYDDLVPSLTAKLDPEFTQNVGNLRGLARNLTPDYANKFQTLLDSEVMGRFAPQTGAITGESLKEAESQLGQQASRFGKLQDGHAQDYADAVRELQAQLRGLVQRQNPQAAEKLSGINSGWANLVRVESAAGRQGATGGVFTPSQLQGAVRASDNSVRKSATARGGAMMQDLASAGKDVLPSSVPDSGSPYRHALEALVALLVGSEAHALPLMLKGAAAGGVVGGAYSRLGQKVVTPLMTARPAQAQILTDALARLKAPAVPAGGAAAVALRQAGAQ